MKAVNDLKLIRKQLNSENPDVCIAGILSVDYVIRDLLSIQRSQIQAP